MPSVEEIASKYASQLMELRNNSKPLINSLTMMAEDHIRHAKIIVETIESHLKKVEPEYKLPILYLIDSIVKNVKKDYVPLFSTNINATFTDAFSQVSEKIRTQLFKLRQTWNEVFPTKQLYAIDVRCRRVDPGWPITAAPPSSAPQIHVNPKFIQRALTVPSTTTSSPVFVPTVSTAPILSTLSTAGGLADLGPICLEPPVDETEAQMREQLLIKQKELLELQTKKLELELLHAKAQLEARTRKQVDVHQTKQQNDAHQVMQQQLQIQAERAKTQTDLATSILSKYSVPPASDSSSVSPNYTPSSKTSSQQQAAEVMQDPRKRRSRDKSDEKSNKHHHSSNSSHQRDSPRQSRIVPSQVTTSSTMPVLTSTISVLPPIPLSSALVSPSEVWKKSESPSSQHKRDEIKREREEHLKREEVAIKRERDEFIRKEVEESRRREREETLKREREEIVKREQRTPPPRDIHLLDIDFLSPATSSLGSSSGGRSKSPSSRSSPTKGSSSSSQKSASPTKEVSSSPLSDPRKRKRQNSKSHDYSTTSSAAKRDSKDKDKDRHGSRQSAVSSTSPVHTVEPSSSTTGDIPSKRRKKSSEDSSSAIRDKDKDKAKDSSASSSSKEKNTRSSSKSKSSSSRRGRDTPSSSSSTTNKSPKGKDWERNKVDYNARKTAVLKRSYRITTEVSKMVDEEEEALQKDGVQQLLSKNKDKENLHRGRGQLGLETSESSLVPGPSGKMGSDVDFRYDGLLQDVDYRATEAGPAGLTSPNGENMETGLEHSQQHASPGKKSRNGNLIDDLFGGEDVDYRQPHAAPHPPSSSNWAQVKRPSMSDSDMGSPIHRRPLGKMIPPLMKEDEDIRDIVLMHSRPPPAISPANSVDSNRSTCDPLGRPLLYNRLPDDPMERKRSLDSRASIDPVERFRAQFIEGPSLGTGHLKMEDLKKAVLNAQQQFERGFLTGDQHEVIMRQLVQINEVSKIRDVQMQQGIVPSAPGPNPWIADSESNDAWSRFSDARGPTEFTSRFPEQPNPWGNVQPMGMAGPWGQQQQQPTGPNPFELAAEGMLPLVNMMELEKVRKDTAKTIPIDKSLRQVRFYGETAIVLQGDEPREISFHKGVPKNVFIDQERDPVRCYIGKPVLIYLNRKKCNLKLGAPTRELYIEGDYYEALFGGPPVRVQVGRHFHSFKLEGPPPQVEMGKLVRYDLLAGRVNLVIDGNLTNVYLDNKPQLLDLCGFPVILRFRDNFNTVLLNGQPFPTDFGGAPMTVTVPSGRKHYLRFASLSPVTLRNINQYIRARNRDIDGQFMGDGFAFAGNFRGTRGGTNRGGRGGPVQTGRGMSRANPFAPQPLMPLMGNQDIPPLLPGVDPFQPAMGLDSNPLDMLANFMPVPDSGHGAMDSTQNSYVSVNRMEEGDRSEESQEQQINPLASLNIQDLFNKLLTVGLIPAAEATSSTSVEEQEEEEAAPEVKTETDTAEPDSSTTEEVSSSTVKEEIKEEKEKENIIPPLETVDVPWDKLKERRDKLIAQICTGVQCGSCGLRFPPDQIVRYSQHLDWHFRQNRREKANARKALSRKWYYDLSDWIQIGLEIEEADDREPSAFDTAFLEQTSDVHSPGTVLNPDLYTVPSAGHDGAICPQCNYGFESLYDHEKEEWILRDAHLAESEEPGVMKLYHPICHQDFMAALQGKSMLTEASKKRDEESAAEVPMEVDEVAAGATAAETSENKDVADDDEVLILQEGKPEPVVMDIIEEEEEEEDIVVPDDEDKGDDKVYSPSEDTSNLDSEGAAAVVVDSNKDAVEKISDDDNRKDSDNQNDESMICIDDENNVVEINNKTDTEEISSSNDNVITHDNALETNNSMVDSVSENNVIATTAPTTATNNNNNNAISVSVLSSLAESSQSPATITIADEDELYPLPGISSQDDIFDIVLGGSSQGFPTAGSTEPEEPKRIIYESMKFDVPTIKIKEEPLSDHEEEEDAGVRTLDEEIATNIGETNISGPPEEVIIPDDVDSIDIDLTADDDTMDELVEEHPNVAIDGNLHFHSEAPVSKMRMMMAPGSKIRIRIADAVLGAESQSPKSTPPHVAEAPAVPSPKNPEEKSDSKENNNSDSELVESESVPIMDERQAVLKPRLVGRKLVNYPPKKTGKEVSGLCTIC